MVNDRQIFDASFIRAHVSILRSANDFWSRPIDGQTLLAHLTNAASVEFTEIPGASHYDHLQSTPDRQKFLDPVLVFTSSSEKER